MNTDAVKGGAGTLKKRLIRDWNMNKWKYVIIIPVLVYLALFCYKPMYGLIIAFKDYKITRGIQGSSWANPWYKWFVNFVTDPYFPRVIKNTFLLSGLTIVFSFPAPILLALLINEVRNRTFKRTVQTITYMPYFISMVVLCAMVKIFCMQDGLFGQIAVSLGGTAENYLVNPGYFRTIYVVSDIWQKIGWDSIIYLAALSAIDQEQYEAAMIDGASRMQKIWYITVPGLFSTYFVLLIMSIGNFLNTGMEQFYVFQNAMNKEHIEVLDLYVYNLGIGTSNNIPFATAVGIMKSGIALLLFAFANILSKKVRGTSVF